MKSKLFALICTLLLLFTGCAPAPVDDFADYDLGEYPIIENVTAKTEFPEYDGNTERISVTVTNNSDENFFYGELFSLEKRVDEQWRPLKIQGYFTTSLSQVDAHGSGSISAVLKDHVKLPLLPGHYRVWVGIFGSDESTGAFVAEYSRVVPAEFDVK